MQLSTNKLRDFPQNGNGHHNVKEVSGPSDTVFTRPAPEGAATVGRISRRRNPPFTAWRKYRRNTLRYCALHLMSQSQLHKQFFISDLEWLVMTPVLLQQFRLFYDKDKPIGVAFWATVSEEVEERLKVGTTRLRPQDWKSGDRLWVVEVIAPFGGAEEMVKDLKAKVFAERQLRYLAIGSGGQKTVNTL